MRYGSVCSGVEAASLAWMPLGWKPVFFAEVEPFPCAVLQQRFNATKPLHPLDPAEAVDEKDRKMRESWLKQINKLPDTGTIPNLGDFTKIKGEDYVGAVDLLVGGTPCFPAGNLVLTDFGYKPIEDIKVGDRVLSHTGKLNTVLRIGSKVADNVGECKVLGRPAFKVTANHPFLVCHARRDNRRSSESYGRIVFDSETEFKPIGESEKAFGCLIGAKAEIEIPEMPDVYDSTFDQIMELCGWYLGDGYIRGFSGKNKKAVILCLSKKKLEAFEKRYANIRYSIAWERTSCKVQIACTKFADFLTRWFGRHATEKRIPAWVYSCNQQSRERLIYGYRMTDGHDGRNATCFTTVSPALAYGIADLCEFASVFKTEVNPTTVIENRTVNQHTWYSTRHYRASKMQRKNGFILSRIQKFTPTNQPETVYNIEVENDHSYIVNGLCVHNCQDLSVAGKRAGFEGARSSLALDFVRLAYEARCQYFVWENVPGVFSSNRGRDFATLLSMFCGYRIEPPKSGWRSTGIVQNRRPDRYGLAWRVLDAQFTRVSGFPFAVPQRRRRVFLVGCLGDWERAASILLEPDRLSWDTPPRIKTREILAGGAENGTETAISNCRHGGGEIADTIGATYYKGIGNRNGDERPFICFHGSQDTIMNETHANAIGRNGGLENCVCYDARGNGDSETVNTITGDHCNRVTDYTPLVQNAVASLEKFWNGEDVASTITQRVDQNRMPDKDQFHGIVNQQTVRRLLPIECERLMGFPDNHTRIEWNGKPAEDCPDAPRYKACGNSMCVNVMEWIGRRIDSVDKRLNRKENP